MYALAGLTNRETGWGIADDSFRTLEALGRLGAETWFGLGDLDIATHIRRTELLGQGRTLSEATAEITLHLGIEHPIVPMSDDPLRTVALTDEGELAFQDYFVRHACEPKITGVRFEGGDKAWPSPGLSRALLKADAIVFCPSNPLVSIGPVLAVPGVHDEIAAFTGPRIVVSPIVGGKALKGPAAKMMAELGHEVSSVGVARYYLGLCDSLVIDTVDVSEASAVEALGMGAVVTSTVMQSDDDKDRLAREIVALAEQMDA
jgi:LPPG:FO 2-phospho-L-lactate transferase